MARVNKTLQKIWVADSETDPFKAGRVPKPFIWGLYHPLSGEYYEFEKTEDFIEFVSGMEIILYAHNGGKFDWHFIIENIEDYEPLTVIAGRLAKFKIGLCEFRDSYNIIPAPLAAYQKTEIDYSIFEEGEREKPENMGVIREYLKDDCVYLGQMVIDFIKTYGMNLTQAGAAMKFWAKLADIERPRSSKYYYEEMQKYYYGGRVECFETGEIYDEFEVIDIRSAYPWAMKLKHPWGMEYSTDDTLDGMSDDEISRAFITLNAQSLGAFPIRTKTGLRFPNDGEMREFNISGWEYLAARDTGTLQNESVKEVRYYADTISFGEYVDYFFALKDEADLNLKKIDQNDPNYGKWASQRLFAKLFLNSLYGKFASNPENYQEFMTLPADMLEGAKEIDGWFYCKLVNERTAVVNRPLEEEKQRYFDVAIAASITGCVRAYLWKSIKQCDGVIYCDTDSIAARNVSGADIGPKLGQWEREATCDYGAVAGKKLYAFKRKDGTYNPDKEKVWKTASKGVRLSPEQIILIAQGEIVVDTPESPTFSIKRPQIFTPRSIKKLDVEKLGI
jgi:hypothetical protein